MHKAGTETEVPLLKQWLRNILNDLLQNLELCGCLIVGANSRKLFMQQVWIKILYSILYQVELHSPLTNSSGSSPGANSPSSS